VFLVLRQVIDSAARQLLLVGFHVFLVVREGCRLRTKCSVTDCPEIFDGCGHKATPTYSFSMDGSAKRRKTGTNQLKFCVFFSVPKPVEKENYKREKRLHKVE
jgi:hypothetical protein